jgi:hypothetical protein
MRERERNRDSVEDGYERYRRETNEWFKERKHFLKGGENAVNIGAASRSHRIHSILFA